MNKTELAKAAWMASQAQAQAAQAETKGLVAKLNTKAVMESSIAFETVKTALKTASDKSDAAFLLMGEAYAAYVSACDAADNDASFYEAQNFKDQDWLAGA